MTTYALCTHHPDKDEAPPHTLSLVDKSGPSSPLLPPYRMLDNMQHRVPGIAPLSAFLAPGALVAYHLPPTPVLSPHSTTLSHLLYHSIPLFSLSQTQPHKK
ncbi:hypothetical protein Pelo_14810 [Pelomyxa schiedti]|nr:hypothetical protein Pelo_14810 [Pelomyxa schiedti]